MRDGEGKGEFFAVWETTFSAAHPSGFCGEGDVFFCDFSRGGDGDEKGDITFVAIAGVNAHEGFFGIRPSDFGGGEAFW